MGSFQKSIEKANGINCTKFAHQQVAQIIAESEKFLRLKVLPDESSSESEDSEEEELDANGNPKLKVPGFVNFRTKYYFRKIILIRQKSVFL